MKQILKDIIEDQKSFLQKKDYIPRVFDENIIQGEQIVIITVLDVVANLSYCNK